MANRDGNESVVFFQGEFRKSLTLIIVFSAQEVRNLHAIFSFATLWFQSFVVVYFSISQDYIFHTSSLIIQIDILIPVLVFSLNLVHGLSNFLHFHFKELLMFTVSDDFD